MSASTSPFIPEAAPEVEVSDGPADSVAPSTQAQNVRLANDRPGSGLRDLTREQLEAMVSDGKRSVELAEEELERRQRIERWANAPPVTFPIVLAPEFGWLADDPRDFHEGLQREPIDPAWSPRVEALLQSFFARREITERYGPPTINCRRTGCEIAFVAYGIDNSGRVTAAAARAGTTPDFFTDEDFRRTTLEFVDQPWAAEEFLYRYFAPNIESVNDATTFLVFLPRAGSPQE